MPARVGALVYDLNSVMSKDSMVVVDIGGGQGEMLLELKEAYPYLKRENPILQEFNADTTPRANITAMEWNFKGPELQLVTGANVYNLMHICHNLPEENCHDDGPNSRAWIQKFSKSLKNSNIHTGMITWFGGRERGSEEWHTMAEIAGLKVAFEGYAELGERAG